jgi:SsrA-binding protein
LTNKDTPAKLVCQNRKAHHSFFIDKKMEAGISLWGSEVKSLRLGKAHLTDAYVDLRDGRPVLVGAHIAMYGNASHIQHEPMRDRFLLLNKREIKRLEKDTQTKGYTVVPLKIYFRGPYAKVEIALAKGKKEYDKRDDIKAREASRDISRESKYSR